MTDGNSATATNKLLGRAKNLLLSPKKEWEQIASEEISTGDIFRNWVLIFAAIGPIAGFIGSQLFGHSLFGITYRPGFGAALTTAITGYALAIVGTYVAALIFNRLAPNFNGKADMVAAVKLAAFSFTAGWLSGIFQLIPGLAWLSILGLYSFYLLYVGGPLLMQIPTEKAMGFTIVSVLVSFVLFLIIGAVASRATSAFAPSSPASSGRLSGEVKVPGLGSIDLSKVDEAARQMEDLGKSIQSGSTEALGSDQLEALLPASLGQWKRTEISSSSAGVAGFGGAQAEATYRNGDQAFTLEVTDMAAIGGLAAMAGAANVQSSRQTETGYSRTRTIDGRLTTEEWDHDSQRGKYSVIVGNRFMIEASGAASDIKVLQQAVQSVGLKKLDKIASR